MIQVPEIGLNLKLQKGEGRTSLLNTWYIHTAQEPDREQDRDQDRDRNQDPSFPIGPVSFPVPFPCSANKLSIDLI